MRPFFLALLLTFLAQGDAFSQSGCTDPQASNYDSGAASNDGSCLYANTNYSLITQATLPGGLKENSGLLLAGGALWTHGDGGAGPVIYEIDSLSGAVLRTINIEGASNVDWEDICFDGTNFYIGDFGNNANGNRTDLVIYKFPLAEIPAGVNASVPATAVEQLAFSYEDQTDFAPQGSNNTRFDCEAMIWRNDSLHLFTKDWIDYHTVHYTIPAIPGTHQAKKRETLLAEGLITGADITEKGVLALLGYRDDNGALLLWMLFDYSNGNFFSGNKRQIGLGLAAFSGQVEGICFSAAAQGYISNEELTVVLLGTPITIPARLYRFSIAQWLQPVFLPVHTPSKRNTSPCRLEPNPVRSGEIYRIRMPLPERTQLQVLNAAGQVVWSGRAKNWNAPKVETGVYFVQAFRENGTVLCKDKLIVR